MSNDSDRLQAELNALREAVFLNHNRVPEDSPFNAEGRDVCGTCMDGHAPADWPCPTFAALDAHQSGEAVVMTGKAVGIRCGMQGCGDPTCNPAARG